MGEMILRWLTESGLRDISFQAKVGEFLLFAGCMGIVIVLFRLLTGTIGRRWQAKTRYLLWLVVLVRLCIPVTLPIPHLTQTVVHTAVEPEQMVEQVQMPDGSTDITVTPYATYAVAQRTGTNTSEESTVVRSWYVDLNFWLPVVLLGFWLGGALVVLVVHRVGYRQMQTQLERSLVPAEEHTVQRFWGVAKEMGMDVYTLPTVYVSDRVDSPCLCGFIEPKIVLPKDILPALEDVELRGILAHELTHYRRHDLWVQLFSLVVCAVYWFHPLVWLADRWMREEMELSCDEAVLHAVAERTTYAEAMYKVLRQCHRRSYPMTTGFSGRRRAMKHRFENIMDTKKKTHSWGGVAGIVALCLVAGSVVSCVVEEAPVTMEKTNLSSGFVLGESYAEEITVNEQVSTYTEEAVPVFVNGSWLVDTDGDPVAAKRKEDGSGWLVDAVSILQVLYPGHCGSGIEGSEDQWTLTLSHATTGENSWDLTHSYSATNPESWENNIRQIVNKDGVEEKTHMPLEIEKVGEAASGAPLYRVWMEPEDVAWFCQATLTLYDGTNTDGYLNGMPHMSFSLYPENATVLTEKEAMETAKTLLIEAYENTYGTYDPPREEPASTPYPGDEVMLPWQIENLTCIGENDRFFRLSFVWDILVDKYTGDVYSHYNGMSQTYSILDPTMGNIFAFAG